MWLGRCACGRDIVRPTVIAVATGATIRAAVLARAGWRRQACGRGGRLDVHHLIKRAQVARTSTSTSWSPSADGAPSKPTPRMRGGGCSSWAWGWAIALSVIEERLSRALTSMPTAIMFRT